MIKSLSTMLDILVHIAREDRVEGSKHTHEAFPINGGDLDFGLGDDVGGSGLALEESTLTEVVSGAVLLNLGGSGTSSKALRGDAFPTD